MALIVFALLVASAAATGARFRPGEWYERLAKPRWTPPNWAFPVVWVLLYAAIAYAGWLVWRETGWSAPIALWGVQLALNAAWSWLFFGLRRMGWAMADVSALVLAVLAFVVAARDVSVVASLLFLPYLTWVVTAAALNLRVMQLNPVAARTG